MQEPVRPALFLDRDGVINEEIGYLHRLEDVRFLPGAADLIRTANALEMPVIVITNQAGIGRGFYSEAQFQTLMHGMRETLSKQGAQIDAVYFSPFHPEHGLGHYRRDTDCRKPKPGMLLQAAQEHAIHLAASALVGDRCSDIEAGAAAGVPHRFLIQGTESQPCSCAAYTQVLHLAEVKSWLLQHYRAVPATSRPTPDPSIEPHAVAS